MVRNALDKHHLTLGLSPAMAFSKVWVGMAGYDRPLLKPMIERALSEFFGMSLDGGLKISSDIDLLPAALPHEPHITSAIVLVVGTGSVAMSYRRRGREFHRIGRAGGWGRLLGDDGSGYAIGREGIRKTLRDCDLHNLRKSMGIESAPFKQLSQAILDHFQSMYPTCTPDTLLSHLLVPDPAEDIGGRSDASRTRTIASAASAVFAVANKDAEARQVVESGASSVAELVQMLVEEQGIIVTECALVLGGGLMGNCMYRETVCSIIQRHCSGFNQVRFIAQPAIAVSKALVERM